MPSPDLKQALFIQTFLAITQMCVSSERGEDWWWVWDRVIKLSSLQSQASKQPSRLHKHIKRTSLTMLCLWLSLNWHWDIKGKLLWAEAICCYAVLCPLFTHNTAVAQRWRWPGDDAGPCGRRHERHERRYQRSDKRQRCTIHPTMCPTFEFFSCLLGIFWSNFSFLTSDIS